MKEEMAIIGRIVSPYGVKGFVKVYPYSDFIERCFSLKRVCLKSPAESLFEYGVEESHIYKNMWKIKFVGVNSREEAQALQGFLVVIPLEERVPLPEGRYYFDEIIGLQVFTVDGTLLGRVRDILQTGSNDIYVVEPADSFRESRKEILVPAIKKVVKEINFDEARILITPLEDLI